MDNKTDLQLLYEALVVARNIQEGRGDSGPVAQVAKKAEREGPTAPSNRDKLCSSLAQPPKPVKPKPVSPYNNVRAMFKDQVNLILDQKAGKLYGIKYKETEAEKQRRLREDRERQNRMITYNLKRGAKSKNAKATTKAKKPNKPLGKLLVFRRTTKRDGDS